MTSQTQLKQTSNLKHIRLYSHSGLDDFRACARYYLFSHVYFWQPVQKGLPLIFGGAWHTGMDVIWQNYAAVKADFDQVAKKAYEAFNNHWVSAGMTHPDELSPDELEEIAPRTPQVALEMFYHYIDARQHIFKDPSFKLLEIEEPFAIPLDPKDDSLFYVGRTDKKIEYRRQHLVVEHKTSSSYKKDGPFRSDFMDSFSPNAQITGYLYRNRMDSGDKSGGVWVDAALVHKQVHDGFRIIPIDQKDDQIDSWLWETHTWIDQIESNLEILEERSKLDVPYLAAFPKNTKSCGNYGGCKYRDICNAVANPAKLSGPPLGYETRKFSLFDEIKLEKLGFTREKI